MNSSDASFLDEISADCPCVGHCTTALGDDVCRSCLRTLDEVTRWPQMSDDERRAVNGRIATERAVQTRV
ncbi:MAG TPA: DUF1289 domain-containing protein [Gallionella sp.]|nr:DUF1289 domain-containing protein [Gallionella sp.]